MRIREALTEILVILATITIIVVTVLLLKHSGTTTDTSAARQTSCVVTECREGNGLYVVTVQDREGNLWDYYDDDWIRSGHLVAVTFDGDEIVAVRR